MSLGRRLRDLRYKIFYGAILSKGCRLTELGNRQGYFQWTFCPDGLGPGSIVYSGGVGKDLSFEKGLVKEYGCPVVLFDGTPTGNQTMSLPENNLPQFKYNRAALADKPGKLHLTPPESSEEGSWSLQNAGTATIEVPCIDLSTLMEQNGHSHIDLLKIDIEGAEYGVLDDLLQRHLPVRQVLVEFHHLYLPAIRRSQTIRAILKMIASGYRLVHYEVGNHTFLRR